MDFSNLFKSIWNMALGLIEVIGFVWNWLISPIQINVPFLADIPLVGNFFQVSFEYSPLEFLGVGIVLLLVLWFVKHLIPLG